MKMYKSSYQLLRAWLSDEDGAVTVDFVVITAAVIGLTIAITITFGQTAKDHSERVEDHYVDTGIQTY